MIKKVYAVTVVDTKDGLRFLFGGVRNPLTFLFVLFFGFLYFALYILVFPVINFLVGLMGKPICPLIANDGFCSKCKYPHKCSCHPISYLTSDQE